MKLETPLFLQKAAKESRCKLYIVGGYVRNSLLGLGDTDIDICGECLPQDLGINAKIVPVNKKLGTALIVNDNEQYEYTPFRSESYSDGGEHRPTDVSFGVSLQEDAARRDFTAGAVYYDIADDEFIDPYNGLQDIYNHVLRAADPDFIFNDDGLRLMRLARLAAETGFEIDKTTFETAIKYKDRLGEISVERKRAELDKILLADLKYGVIDAHYRGLQLLKQLKLWDYIIKEVADMEGVSQNPKYHLYDVMEHTFLAVKFAEPEVRLAALMHDIAKPTCQLRDGNTYDHDVEGEIMTKRILGQHGLKYPNKIVSEISSLVRLHLYDLSGLTRKNKLRVFVAKNFELIPKLVKLIKADGKATCLREIERHRFSEVYDELIRENAPIRLTDLKIDGSDVVSAGIKGAKIKQVLQDIWKECIIDPKRNDRELLLTKIARIASKIKE